MAWWNGSHPLNGVFKQSLDIHLLEMISGFPASSKEVTRWLTAGAMYIYPTLCFYVLVAGLYTNCGCLIEVCIAYPKASVLGTFNSIYKNQFLFLPLFIPLHISSLAMHINTLKKKLCTIKCKYTQKKITFLSQTKLEYGLVFCLLHKSVVQPMFSAVDHSGLQLMTTPDQ